MWIFAWDNSPQNPGNPDPTKAVRRGDQTFEEMGIGFVRFRYVDEEVRQSPSRLNQTVRTLAETANTADSTKDFGHR